MNTRKLQPGARPVYRGVDQRVCARCKQEKPANNFIVRAGGSLGSYCRACRTKIQYNWVHRQKVISLETEFMELTLEEVCVVVTHYVRHSADPQETAKCLIKALQVFLPTAPRLLKAADFIAELSQE